MRIIIIIINIRFCASYTHVICSAVFFVCSIYKLVKNTKTVHAENRVKNQKQIRFFSWAGGRTRHTSKSFVSKMLTISDETG